MKILKFLNNNKFLIIIIVILILWSFAPIIWSIVVSISPEANLASKPPKFIINELSFKNYLTLLTGINAKTGEVDLQGVLFRKGLLNSVIVSVSTVVLGASLSTISGYALSRFRFFGRKFLFLFIILVMPIPLVVIVIPLTKIMGAFNLIDSYLGLTLIYSALILPITTWLATSYFHSIPSDIEDASYIDGCSPMQTFFRILIPLAKPVIGTNIIIIFLYSWSRFFTPFLLASKNAKQVTVVIAEFAGNFLIERGLMSAAGIIALLPPLILTMIFSKFIVSGLTAGSIK